MAGFRDQELYPADRVDFTKLDLAQAQDRLIWSLHLLRHCQKRSANVAVCNDVVKSFLLVETGAILA